MEDSTGGVVGDVVAIEGGGVASELAQSRAEVHEGDMDQDEAGAVAEAPVEDVAHYDEGGPDHGAHAGQPHQDPEGHATLPAQRRVRLLVTAADHPLFVLVPQHLSPVTLCHLQRSTLLNARAAIKKVHKGFV